MEHFNGLTPAEAERLELLGLKSLLTLAQFKPALAMNPELQARCVTSPPGID